MGLFITITYIIFLFIRPQDWLPLLKSFHPMDIIMLGGIYLLFTELFKTGSKKRLTDCPQLWLLLGLWSILILTFPSEAPSTFMMMLQRILPFTMVVLFVRSQKDYELLLNCLLIGLTFLCIHCTKQHFTGTGFGGVDPLMRQAPDGSTVRQVRAFGIFSGPNEMGTVCGIGMVITLSFIRIYKNNLLRLITYSALFLLMMNVLLWTDSRQAILIMAGGIGGAFFSWKRKWITLAVLPILLIAGMGASVRWGGDIGSDRSVEKRVMAITDGLHIFKSNPIQGVGIGRSYDRVGQKMPLHNSFLMLLVEAGIIGFTAAIGAIFISFLQNIYLLRCTPDSKEDQKMITFAKTNIGILVALCIGLYFQNRPYHNDNYVYVGVLTAFAMNVKELYSIKNPGYFSPSWLLKRGAIFIGSSAIFVILMLHFTSKLYWINFR